MLKATFPVTTKRQLPLTSFNNGPWFENSITGVLSEFFNKLLESEEKINLFIISENVQKSTIDYIKEKCNGLFCNYKINVFEYGDILLGNIELDIENIIIKDNHGLQFYFLNDNWIEKSI